jgi:transglutaminase-like putative cysteine protease
MGIRVALRHSTSYRYDHPVALSPHVVRLRPAPHCRTPIESYSLKIAPAEHFINWQQDPFGNYLARLVFPERTAELHIEVGLVADMTVINPFDFFLDEDAEYYPFGYGEHLAQELAPYLELQEREPRLLAWLAGVDRRPRMAIGRNMQTFSSARWRNGWASPRTWCCPATRTCSTISGRRPSCPSTSTPCGRTSTSPSSGGG